MALTREDIAGVAEEHGVGAPVAALIAEHARPGIALLADGSTTDPAGTKGGGLPALPQGVQWPSSTGYPQVHLLQLRLADLPDLGELPRAGLLSVFVPWDSDCGHMAGAAAVMLIPDDSDLAPVYPPQALIDQDELDYGQLDGMALRPELIWTVPTPPRLLRLAPELPATNDDWMGRAPVGFDSEQHHEIRQKLLEDVTQIVWEGRTEMQAQLLGWPSIGTQGGDIEEHGPQSEITAERWRALLEIPSNKLIPSFGDGGEGWVALPSPDLQSARFDRCYSSCETA